MSRYVLTERTKKILEARKYKLVCKICDCPLLVGDEIESKQQRRGMSKLYHASCYDASFMELPDVTDEEVEKFFSRPKAVLTDERIIVWIVRSL